MQQLKRTTPYASSVDRFLRLVAISCLSVCAFQPGAFASTFAPTQEELNNIREGFPGAGIVSRQFPRQVEQGRTFVQIDDMRFPVLDGVESAFTGPRWTNGIVYYVFDGAVTTAHRQAWRDAAANWSAAAPLTFIEGQGSGNYIHVQNSTVNNSWVGMIGGGQDVNIVSWNSEFTIAHEIGHALGATHEHQRSGRDSFVQISTSNIQAGQGPQFTLQSTTNYGSYDFDSVMHYSKCAFSIDCPTGTSCNCSNYTITVLPPNTGLWQDAIGQITHLSQLDQSGMAQRYAGTPTPTPTVPPCGGLSQDFDGVTSPALPSGWVATNNTGDATRWVTSTTTPHTAPNDAFIPDQDGIGDKYLDSPSIAITSASAQVSFRNYFNLEHDPPPSEVFWDGGVLEVSSANINGGAFTDVTAVGGSFVTGGYTGMIDGTAGNPLAGRMAWSGSSGGYINTVVNLGPNVNGQTVRLRFRLGTDEAVSAPGWRIDTVSVTAGPCGTPTPPPTTTTLGNISTRLRVETGDNVLIGGFIITGTQAKSVMLRAIGPSLPFAGAISDPVLELRDSSGGLIAWNDDWRFRPDGSSQQAEIVATGIPPANILESALVATLPANSAYTAIVSGYNNATGIGVVEAYDLDRTVDSRLANISTRGLVGTGDNVMIAGTIIIGTNPASVLLRAIGPSLANFGVPNALPDPTIELRDSNGTLIAFNDDWRFRPDGSSQQAEIIATGIPPADILESALVATLPANNAAYTAIVRGYRNLTGVAVVEAYQLQ
jgi:Astacin (Peptidase family M12A)